MQSVRRIQTSRGSVEYVDVGQGIPVLYFHGNGISNDARFLVSRPINQDIPNDVVKTAGTSD
jgi:hypothetical protein